MQLDEIKAGLRINGVVPGEVIEVISAIPFGHDAVELIYRRHDGSLGQQWRSALNPAIISDMQMDRMTTVGTRAFALEIADICRSLLMVFWLSPLQR